MAGEATRNWQELIPLIGLAIILLSRFVRRKRAQGVAEPEPPDAGRAAAAPRNVSVNPPRSPSAEIARSNKPYPGT
jgi:predicted lipid-binding transport protein (Tim44 family)